MVIFEVAIVNIEGFHSLPYSIIMQQRKILVIGLSSRISGEIFDLIVRTLSW